MKISLYCTCGDCASGECDTPDKFRLAWDTIHSGPGHAPTDAATAAAARRLRNRAQRAEDSDWPLHVTGEDERE